MTFTFITPTENLSPVVIGVPHAGIKIPDWCRNSFAPTDPLILSSDSDLFVDELYASAPQFGIPLLSTSICRYVIDLNRDPKARDASFVQGGPVTTNPQHLGLVAHKTMHGEDLLIAPLTEAEIQRRVDLYHKPFHDELLKTMTALRARFGFCMSFEGHSMPAKASQGHLDCGTERADIVLGTQDGKSCSPKLTDFIVKHFTAAGLSVALNTPYKGAYVTQHYGRPADGFHSILVEINRKLYMDEETHKKKPSEFAQLKKILDALMKELKDIHV